MLSVAVFDANTCTMMEEYALVVDFEEVKAFAASLQNNVADKAKTVIEKVNTIKKDFTDNVKNIISSNNKENVTVANNDVATVTESKVPEWMVDGVDMRKVFDPSCCRMMEYLHEMTPEEKTKAMAKKMEREKNFVPTIETAVMHYQMGIEEAFDWLYRQFEDKIVNFAKSKTLNQLDREDLIDRLNQCFVITVSKYRGGTCFKTYWWTCAQNEVGAFFKNKNAKKRTTEDKQANVSLDQKYGESDGELIDIVQCDAHEKMERTIFLRDIINNQIRPILNDKEIEVIDLLIQGYDKADINRYLNLTRAAVYNRIKRIQAKLMKVFTPQQIAGFFA